MDEEIPPSKQPKKFGWKSRLSIFLASASASLIAIYTVIEQVRQAIGK